MYDATLSQLQIALEELRVAQKLVEEDTVKVIASNDHIELVRHYARLRGINELIGVARKSLAIIEDRLSHTEIPDIFREHGLKTITLEDVGRVSIGHRWSCSMIDKAIGMNYLREQGDGGLIIETVNSSTLAAHAKNLNEQGKDLPQDKFTTSIMPYTSITKP